MCAVTNIRVRSQNIVRVVPNGKQGDSTMKKIKPAWCFDSPDDYYEQFEDIRADEEDVPDDEISALDDDCEYWKTNCYGRG